MQDIILNILRVTNMAEKIITDVGDNSEGSIVLILTIEEYELFRITCLELLDYYGLNKRKIKKVIRILEKLEKGKNNKNI